MAAIFGTETTTSTIVTLDSITMLRPIHADCVAVSGSHGGVYPGYLAAKATLRGVIFSDAGVGLEQAAIGSLALLETVGIPVATVDYRSARIGDAADMFRRGIISYVNEPAAKLGCQIGQHSKRCATLMAARARPGCRAVQAPGEGRVLLREDLPQIRGVDSNSLLKPSDAGALIVSGSHGGLVGGVPGSALRPKALAAAFNDAGIGMENAGLSRLAPLDQRNIPAVTVGTMSARIGDARSSWETGVISAANETARRLGAERGVKLDQFLINIASRVAADPQAL